MTIPTRRVRVTRDGVLFVVGVGGMVVEVYQHGFARPDVLLLFAGMAGLTQFLRSDEKHAEEKTEREE